MKPPQFTFAVALALCLTAACAQHPAGREVNASGISLRYDPADFPSHTMRREPRLTARENGSDVPIDVAPERSRILLGSSPDNYVLLTPLRDPSVPSFAEAYPQVDEAARTLRAALADSRLPDGKQLETAGLAIDSEFSFHTRLELLRTPNLAGFVFLVQDTQEDHPNPANNDELSYRFAGLTADGAHRVEANFRVTHPSLPRDPSATSATVRDDAGAYLRRDEQRLAAFPADSFHPSLDHLKTLLRSISVRP